MFGKAQSEKLWQTVAIQCIIIKYVSMSQGYGGQNSMKLVVTVVGTDRVGIIAMVTRILADNNVNILSINQNIMDGFFNMILLAEAAESKIKLVDLQKVLREQGEEIGVEIKAQHQDIFNVMHNI